MKQMEIKTGVTREPKSKIDRKHIMKDVTRILVTTDLSANSQVALPWADALADKLNAEMTFLCVINPHPFTGLDNCTMPHAMGFNVEETEVEAQKKMKKILALQSIDREVEVRTIRNAIPHEGILRMIKVVEYDYVVMATHGYTGMEVVLLGSVTGRVVRHCPCPVLCVRGISDEVSINRILCPTDFSDRAQIGVDEGVSLAEKFDAQIDLLHVAHCDSNYGYAAYAASGDDNENQKLCRSKLDEVASRVNGVTVDKWLMSGSVPCSINEMADSTPDDLIVMSSHGHSGLVDYLIGRNTERVIRQSHHPVLVCPAKH